MRAPHHDGRGASRRISISRNSVRKLAVFGVATSALLLGTSLKSDVPDFAEPVFSDAGSGSSPDASSNPAVISLPLKKSVLTVPASRGFLQESVRVTGQLDAVDKSTVYSGCLWTTYLVDIVPEGTFVREGDVVARLEETELREREDRYRVRAFEGRAEVEAARQKLATQELLNERRLAETRLAMELAQLDLQSYRDGELPALLSEKTGGLELARETVARAAERFDYVRRMARKGYQSADDVEDERLKLHKAERKFAVAADTLALLSDYTGDRELKALVADARITRDEYERAESESAVSLRAREISLRTAEQRAAHYNERLTMVEESLAACTLRAPRDGRVLWARTDSSRGYSTLEPGESVSNKQAVFEIPRYDEMVVHIKVQEADSQTVRAGQRAVVRLAARPNVMFRGTVLSIARVPTPDTYPNYDRRVYTAKISVDADPTEMNGLRPGLTASVEVLAGKRPNCVQVPVQSVVKVQDRPVVFVRTKDGVDVRPVQLGLKATSYAEIADGLAAGEEVVLSPRGDLTEQLIRLWQTEAEDKPEVQIAARDAEKTDA